MPRYRISAWRFREARLTCGMGVLACAELLQVGERTIRGWESGATRIPYAAYKLLRVLKGGRYLADPVWADFIIRHDVLITPEGHQFHAGDLSWWSLLVRRAHAFGELATARRAQESAAMGQPKAVSLGARASAVLAPATPVGPAPKPVKRSGGRSPTLGLSSSPSKENKTARPMFHAAGQSQSISRTCDTVSPAGVASAGLAPGADIPVGGVTSTAGLPPAISLAVSP